MQGIPQKYGVFSSFISVRATRFWKLRVHDEIVVEVIENQAEEVRDIVNKAMIKAAETVIKIVPVIADAEIDDYWRK